MKIVNQIVTISIFVLMISQITPVKKSIGESKDYKKYFQSIELNFFDSSYDIFKELLDIRKSIRPEDHIQIVLLTENKNPNILYDNLSKFALTPNPIEITFVKNVEEFQNYDSYHLVIFPKIDLAFGKYLKADYYKLQETKNLVLYKRK
ncbi:hypothetical protein [Leptospira sp. GIMC2001]|uniref:hypothetical protein n=1 Tax=Leptospira sp. GIMC2001 TaxID=1513297 RepID=UPI00234A2442|nr:hypothetical protein [Leptospira sp. GIMC2001]WCL50430.1 hypothetical protein O4O04_06310 [Leptospira sp. GIMC2001]